MLRHSARERVGRQWVALDDREPWVVSRDLPRGTNERGDMAPAGESKIENVSADVAGAAEDEESESHIEKTGQRGKV